MRHDPNERVTQELGIEICKRQGLKALVVPEIDAVGSKYLITLKDRRTDTKVIARRQAEAETKDQVIAALGKAGFAVAKTIRRKPELSREVTMPSRSRDHKAHSRHCKPTEPGRDDRLGAVDDDAVRHVGDVERRRAGRSVVGQSGKTTARRVQRLLLCTFIVRQLVSSWASWEMNWEVRQGTLAMAALAADARSSRTRSAHRGAADARRGDVPVIVLIFAPARRSSCRRLAHLGALGAVPHRAWLSRFCRTSPSAP